LSFGCVRKVPRSNATTQQARCNTRLDSTTSQQSCSTTASTTKDIHSPEDELPCPWSYPRHHTGNDTQGKKHRTQPDQQPQAPLALMQRAITEAYDNLAKQHWFHPLSFQQVQALLTLFSKSFSSFPHGTCLLSVSNPYLASDEIYHPVCAPIPRNVTLRKYAVHNGLQVTDGILTLTDTLFQEVYTCATVSDTSRDYNSKPEASISMLSSSLFIRHY
jgi:hypothetical protein